MPGLKYKEYTADEDKIYNESIAKIRDGVKNGLSFNEAGTAVDIKNEELKDFILDDALKIMIAEMHYGKGLALQQVADALKVPLKKISAANMEMLEDVGVTAAEVYRKSNPDSPVGNA